MYALVDRKDAHHPTARAVVERLLRSGRRLLATDYVIAETVNLANARSGSGVAIRVTVWPGAPTGCPWLMNQIQKDERNCPKPALRANSASPDLHKSLKRWR